MIDYKEAILKTRAYNTVLRDKEAGRLSHTYLLISEDQAYAKAFAKMLARIMLDVEPMSHGDVKIEKDIHPDVQIFGENQKIVTQTVTDIASDVFVRPDEAQNKLLKTIEEPPESAFFVLTSKTERKLLQTVLSRCKKLELDLLDNNTIAKMLVSAGVGEKERNICSACSGGVFSRAYQMASDKEFLNMYQNIYKCLYKMNSSRDVLDFASLFSVKSLNKEEFADLFMLIVRDLCMVKAGVLDLVNNVHKMDEMKLIADGFSLEALYKIIEYCLQLKEDLVYNTNVSASIDEFLLKVVEVKVKCRN